MQRNGKTAEELVTIYQTTGNAEVFEAIAQNMDRLVCKFANKTEGTNETFDDLRGILLEVLWKCCKDWKGNAKLSTMFWTYANNKLRELRQKAHHNNHLASTYADSFNQMQEDIGFDIAMHDDAYNAVDVTDLIERLPLTDKERNFINIRLADECLTKKEIAQRLNVDASAINYFEKSIARKMLAIA